MGKTAERARRKAEAAFLYADWSSKTRWRYEQMVGQERWAKDYEKSKAQYRYHVASATASYEHALETAKVSYQQTYDIRKAAFETAQRKAVAGIITKRAQALQLDAEGTKAMVEAELEKQTEQLKAKKQEADVTVNVAAFAGGVSSKRLLQAVRAEGAEVQSTISLKQEMQEDIRAAQMVVMGRQAEAELIVSPFIEPIYVPPKELVIQDWVEPMEYVDPLYIKPHDPTSEAFTESETNWGGSGLTVGISEVEMTDDYLRATATMTPEELEEYYDVPITPDIAPEEEEEPTIEERETAQLSDFNPLIGEAWKVS